MMSMTLKMFDTDLYRLVVRFIPSVDGQSEEKITMAWEGYTQDALGKPCWVPVKPSLVVEHYVKVRARQEFARALREREQSNTAGGEGV